MVNSPIRSEGMRASQSNPVYGTTEHQLEDTPPSLKRPVKPLQRIKSSTLSSIGIDPDESLYNLPPLPKLSKTQEEEYEGAGPISTIEDSIYTVNTEIDRLMRVRDILHVLEGLR